MSEIKLSLLDEKIAQFCENSTELLTGIHARHKGGTKGTLKLGRRMQKTISIPDPDMNLLDEEPLDL
jgi:hypothetical protein